MNRYLIVVDMQNDFIDGSLGTKEAQEIVENVVKEAKEFQGTVIFTQDTHEKDYLDTQEGQRLPVSHCIKGTAGWELFRSLPGPGRSAGFSQQPRDRKAHLWQRASGGIFKRDPYDPSHRRDPSGGPVHRYMRDQQRAPS